MNIYGSNLIITSSYTAGEVKKIRNEKKTIQDAIWNSTNELPLSMILLFFLISSNSSVNWVPFVDLHGTFLSQVGVELECIL